MVTCSLQAAMRSNFCCPSLDFRLTLVLTLVYKGLNQLQSDLQFAYSNGQQFSFPPLKLRVHVYLQVMQRLCKQLLVKQVECY